MRRVAPTIARRIAPTTPKPTAQRLPQLRQLPTREISKTQAVKHTHVSQAARAAIAATYTKSRLLDRDSQGRITEFYTPAKIKLVSSIYTPEQLREKFDNSAMSPIPEIAVIGRSNVGKSKLINTLAQSELVRVRNLPGVTQSINTYQMGPMCRLVDMPGYGFAEAKDDARDKWKKLILEFLKTRSGLSTFRRLFLLIDARHGLKSNDLEFLREIKPLKLRVQLVMTKCDLLPMETLEKMHQYTLNQLTTLDKNIVPQIPLVSSLTKKGIPHLLSLLYHLTNAKPTTRLSPIGLAAKKDELHKRLHESPKRARKPLWKKMRKADKTFVQLKKKRGVFLTRLANRDPEKTVRKIKMGEFKKGTRATPPKKKVARSRTPTASNRAVPRRL